MKKKLIASSLAVAAVTGLFPINAAMAATTVSATTNTISVKSISNVNCITNQIHKLKEGQWEAVTNLAGYDQNAMYINDIPFKDFDTSESHNSRSNNYNYNVIESLYAKGIPVDVKFIAEIGKTKPSSSGSTKSYSDYTLSTPLFTHKNLDYDALADRGETKKYLIHFKIKLDSKLNCYSYRYSYSATSRDDNTYYELRLNPFEMGISDIVDEMSGINLEQATTITSAYVNNMSVTNGLNENAVKNTVQSMIGENITANINGWNLIPATDTKKGTLSANILLSNESGESSVVTVNKTIDKTEKTATTAKNIIEKIIPSLKVNNTTTQEEILDVLRSGLDNDSINLGISNYKVTNSTEDTTGTATGTVTITDGYGSSSQVVFNIMIDKLQQSLETVYNNYNKIISKLSVSNETTAEDIINTVNITNGNIKVNIDDFKVQQATDSATGKVTGILKITDGFTTKIINLSSTINKLAQSLNTAKNNVTSVLNAMKVDNDTSEESIRKAISVTLDTSVISVDIKDFNKSLATENSKGEITGTVILNDGTSNIEIPIDFGINQLPQSLGTVKNLFEKQLNKFVATNETTAKDILGSIYIANSDIHAEMKDFKLIEAKEEEKGAVSGIIILTDGKTEIEVPVNLEIADLPQTLSNAVNKIQQILNGEVVTNKTTFKELLDRCKDAVSNPNIDIYISPDEKPEKVLATEFSKGSMTGTMIVTDGKTEVQVPINLAIENLPVTENGIKDKVENVITNTDATNDTTKEEVEDKIKDELGDGFDVKIDDFKKDPSTSAEDGKITGTVIVTPEGGESIEIPIEVPIKKLPQTLDEVKTKIQASLDKFTATNETKAKDVLAAIKTNDIDDNISVNFGIEANETFKLIPATETQKGLITGVIYVGNGEDEVTLDVNKSISELTQTVEGAKDNINIILPTLKVTNDTTEENLKELLQNSVESNISVDIKDFKKILATMDSDGKITSTIILSDINTGEKLEIPIELKIDKLSLTLDEAKHRIEVDLSDIQVTNDTNKEELEEKISKKLNDQFDIIVNNFTKEVSTTLIAGKITGDVVIKEKNSENKADASVELTIAKLSQTIDEAKESIKINLDKLVVTNDTTKENLEVQIKSLVGDNIDSTINDFNKVLATTKQTGSVTGTLILVDKNNGSTAEFPISLIIEKISSQSSGGSSGGGSSSSNTNKSDDTLTNEDTKSVENDTTGWRSENGVWRYYDSTGKVLVGWHYINGLWYYFNTNGVLQIGWQQINGLWYYLNPTPGQTLGAMQTGWLNDNGTWYYLEPSGAMKTGWLLDGSTWYYLQSNGAMQTGWLNDNGTWYYLESSGAMKTGWYQDVTGTWYYSYFDGAMAYDTVIDGYTLDSNGAWIN